MTRLYLIRHGDYITTEEERLVDKGLSATGREQARKLHDRLATTNEIKPDILISSTMLRARQTAEIIAPALDIPIVYDNELEEWRNTDGKITADEFMAGLKSTSAEQRPFFYPVPGMENWAEFMLRAGTALNRLTQEHAGKTIVVICHGGIIEASFMFFFGLSTLHIPVVGLDPAHTSITCWRRVMGLTQERWMLEKFNDTYHLNS